MKNLRQTFATEQTKNLKHTLVLAAAILIGLSAAVGAQTAVGYYTRYREQSAASVPTPASSAWQNIYVSSSDHKVYRKDSTGTSTEIGGGGGGTVSADSPLTGDGSGGSHLACATCTTLAGTQTLTNKTLTSPNLMLIDEAALGAADYAGTGLDFAGSYTMGTTIQPTVSGLTIVGMKFYWPVATSLTLKCTLRAADGTVIESKNLAVSGAGVKTVTFDASHALTAWTKYKIATWETSGAHGYSLNGLVSGTVVPGGSINSSMIFAGVMRSQAYYSSGDADPTSDGSGYIMMQEPVFQ